jgi:hypothetical protein
MDTCSKLTFSLAGSLPKPWVFKWQGDVHVNQHGILGYSILSQYNQLYWGREASTAMQNLRLEGINFVLLSFI